MRGPWDADRRRCAAAAGSSDKNTGTVENCTFQVTDHGRSDPAFLSPSADPARSRRGGVVLRLPKVQADDVSHRPPVTRRPFIFAG